MEAELEEVHRLLSVVRDEAELEELLARQGQLQSQFEQLGGYDLEARASRVLAGLGFDQDRLNRDVGELSGGWLMRAALARLLLSAPDLILLDEPTNHLDLESLVWLESHLVTEPRLVDTGKPRPRVFGQGGQPHRGGGRRHGFTSYGGNYSEYEEQRLRKAQGPDLRPLKAQQEKIKPDAGLHRPQPLAEKTGPNRCRAG